MADLDLRLATPKWSRHVSLINRRDDIPDARRLCAARRRRRRRPSGRAEFRSSVPDRPGARTDRSAGRDRALGTAVFKDPRDLDKALAYAASLKALGQKPQALAVLQQASLSTARTRGSPPNTAASPSRWIRSASPRSCSRWRTIPAIRIGVSSWPAARCSRRKAATAIPSASMSGHWRSSPDIRRWSTILPSPTP